MRLALLVCLAGCDSLLLSQNLRTDGGVTPDADDVSETSPCPAAFAGKQHVLGEAYTTWSTAQANCESLRKAPDEKYSYLVVLSSVAEHQQIMAMVGTSTRWIGLTNFEAGVFHWINGESSSIPWDITQGEPDDGGDACGRIEPGGAYDTGCESDFRYVCECSHISLKRELFD